MLTTRKVLKAWFIGWTLYVSAALTVFTIHGCATLEVEACMDHPTYGRVCVVYKGKKITVKSELPPEVLEEVTAWLRERKVIR